MHHTAVLVWRVAHWVTLAAVLYKLGNPTEAVATMPTLGFNVETMRVGKLTLNIWVR